MRAIAAVILTASLAALGSTGVATAPGQAAQGAAPDPYRFTSGTGLLFFYVRPDKTADFEAVAARIADVLQRSTDPVRKQQAAGWRLFKSLEPTRDAAVYVVALDPAVATA